MKRLIKRMIKHPRMQQPIAKLLSWWLRFVYWSCKKTPYIPDTVQPYLQGEKQAIFCFWHGRMIMHPFLKPPKRPMKVLISHHGDGTIITNVLQCFGVGVVRGSSNRGGAEAVLGLQQVASEGCNISITPDGPRGPAYVAAPGAAYLALQTGLPLIAFSFSATKVRIFKRSWDSFMLPMPFGEVIFCASEPMFVVADEEEDVVKLATEKLSTTINKMMRNCDQIAGRQ